MSKIIVGSGTLTLDDLFAIAAFRSEVVLDGPLLEELTAIDSSAEAAPAAVLPKWEPHGDKKTLLERESRAATIGLVATLAHPNLSVRSSVLTFLVDLLNNKALPELCAWDPKRSLIALLVGNAQPLLSSYTPPGLKERELSAVLQSNGCAAGLAAFNQVALSQLVGLADAATAFTAECRKEPLLDFDIDVSDTSKVHAGEIASISAIRGFLVDSKRCTTPLKKGKKKEEHKSHDSLHEGNVVSTYTAHGAARDVIESTRRPLRVELVSSAAGSNTAALAGAIAQLAFAAETLNKACAQRCRGREQSSESPRGPFNAFQPTATVTAGAVMLCGLVCSAYECLVAEMRDADSIMYEEEASTKKAMEEKAAKQKEAEEKKLAALIEKEKSMTEEQRAKAAAKRAAKAKKAQEKAAKKTKSSLFGRGTSSLREYLNARRSAEGAIDMMAVLSPFLRCGVATCAPTAASDADAAVDASFYDFAATTLEALGSGGARRKPKIAKGTRDFMPEQMEVRERAFEIIKSVFKRHGGVEIDTPVFELRETLIGKYGEEGGKLIYDLADQGGEMLCMRYDLTVPFARFLAMHEVGNIKRYHIAKVYRRDNPQISRGRYREFYQCDFDIAGTYPSMMPDAEVLKVASEIISELDIGSFVIKLNHRVLLEAMMELCGVPPSKIKPICSAIDKLDKEEWSDVRREMVEDKGLAPAAADKIGDMVKLHGSPQQLLETLLKEGFFSTHAAGMKALDELRTLFTYLEMMGCLHHISFDLSLARGLHYYTGVIYEVVMTSDGVKVGSVAAGGRYDNLVGMFSSSGSKVPCVGVSIGIERIFALMEAKAKQEGGFAVQPAEVFVASAGKGMVEARMKVCALLWDAGIPAEMTFAEAPKMGKQLNYALERRIPFLVTIGETELANGTAQLKNLKTKEESSVSLGDLVGSLIEQGVKTVKGQGDVL